MTETQESIRKVIQKGSKSFFLASLFFPREIRQDCWVLYRWCRYCDDRIDNFGGVAELEQLRSNTQTALSELTGPEEFRDLAVICRKNSIPSVYPLELLNGFAKDVGSLQVRDQKELEEYAYQVAGVVGLMMSHIMRADLPRAAIAATSMGNAMQLTNIARDIKEDFNRGRIYLPATWLAEEAVNPEKLLDATERERLFTVVKRLLARADWLYEDGERGLIYLPLRAAFAVSIAAEIYSAIGRKILKIGPSAIDRRVYVTLPEKLAFVIAGTYRVLKSFPKRVARWRSKAYGHTTA